MSYEQNINTFFDPSSVNLLNIHQEIWNLSCEDGITPEDARLLRLSAAIFGHYRAFAQATNDEQGILKEIAKINRQWQGWKKILIHDRQHDRVAEFRKIILKINKAII